MSNIDPLQQIERLAELHQKGVLTDAEFTSQKTMALAALNTVTDAKVNVEKNAGGANKVLIGIGYTFVFWFISLVLMGMFASLTHPGFGQEASREAGRQFGALLLCGSVGVSTVLVRLKMLPFTK